MPFLPPGPWTVSPCFLGSLRPSVFYSWLYFQSTIHWHTSSAYKCVVSILPEQNQGLNWLLNPPLVSLLFLLFPSYNQIFELVYWPLSYVPLSDIPTPEWLRLLVLYARTVPMVVIHACFIYFAMHVVNVLVVFLETLCFPGFCGLKCSWFLNNLPACFSQASSQAIRIPLTLKMFLSWGLDFGHLFFSLYLLSLGDFIYTHVLSQPLSMLTIPKSIFPA